MKHIKICKPQPNKTKKNSESKNITLNLKNEKKVDKAALMAMGHSCVPVGNVIDRD